MLVSLARMGRNNDVKIFAKRLKKARDDAYLSQAEFATAARMVVSNIQRLERGKIAGVMRTAIPKLAKALRLTEAEFMERIAVPTNGRTQPKPTNNSGISPINPDQPPRWTLDLRASAWAPFPICELDTDDPRHQSILELGRFQLYILGNCMDPPFKDRSIIELEIIRWETDGLEIGECYAVCRSDGMATFKQLARRDENAIYLRALNQADFPGELTVPLQEIARVARLAGVMKKPDRIPVVKLKKPK